MKLQIGHSSYVIGLFDVFNTNDINLRLNDSLEKAETIVNSKSHLTDWIIYFNFTYIHGADIVIFKSMKPYVGDKQKYIIIHIPIPNLAEVYWGINSKKIGSLETSEKKPKNCTYISIDYKESASLTEHIQKCAKIGIEFTLKSGFTLMGETIKVEEDIFE
jgi:hypothetical protein